MAIDPFDPQAFAATNRARLDHERAVTEERLAQQRARGEQKQQRRRFGLRRQNRAPEVVLEGNVIDESPRIGASDEPLLRQTGQTVRGNMAGGVTVQPQFESRVPPAGGGVRGRAGRYGDAFMQGLRASPAGRFLDFGGGPEVTVIDSDGNHVRGGSAQDIHNEVERIRSEVDAYVRKQYQDAKGVDLRSMGQQARLQAEAKIRSVTDDLMNRLTPYGRDGMAAARQGLRRGAQAIGAGVTAAANAAPGVGARVGQVVGETVGNVVGAAGAAATKGLEAGANLVNRGQVTVDPDVPAASLAGDARDAATRIINNGKEVGGKVVDAVTSKYEDLRSKIAAADARKVNDHVDDLLNKIPEREPRKWGLGSKARDMSRTGTPELEDMQRAIRQALDHPGLAPGNRKPLEDGLKAVEKELKSPSRTGSGGGGKGNPPRRGGAFGAGRTSGGQIKAGLKGLGYAAVPEGIAGPSRIDQFSRRAAAMGSDSPIVEGAAKYAGDIYTGITDIPAATGRAYNRGGANLPESPVIGGAIEIGKTAASALASGVWDSIKEAGGLVEDYATATLTSAGNSQVRDRAKAIQQEMRSLVAEMDSFDDGFGGAPPPEEVARIQARARELGEEIRQINEYNQNAPATYGAALSTLRNERAGLRSNVFGQGFIPEPDSVSTAIIQAQQAPDVSATPVDDPNQPPPEATVPPTAEQVAASETANAIRTGGLLGQGGLRGAPTLETGIDGSTEGEDTLTLRGTGLRGGTANIELIPGGENERKLREKIASGRGLGQSVSFLSSPYSRRRGADGEFSETVDEHQARLRKGMEQGARDAEVRRLRADVSRIGKNKRATLKGEAALARLEQIEAKDAATAKAEAEVQERIRKEGIERGKAAAARMDALNKQLADNPAVVAQQALGGDRQAQSVIEPRMRIEVYSALNSIFPDFMSSLKPDPTTPQFWNLMRADEGGFFFDSSLKSSDNSGIFPTKVTKGDFIKQLTKPVDKGGAGFRDADAQVLYQYVYNQLKRAE